MRCDADYVRFSGWMNNYIIVAIYMMTVTIDPEAQDTTETMALNHLWVNAYCVFLYNTLSANHFW